LGRNKSGGLDTWIIAQDSTSNSNQVKPAGKSDIICFPLFRTAGVTVGQKMADYGRQPPFPGKIIMWGNAVRARLILLKM